jgi:hypothetical protein
MIKVPVAAAVVFKQAAKPLLSNMIYSSTIDVSVRASAMLPRTTSAAGCGINANLY